ncbi:MAG TPA: GHMP kinase [Kiritimatiellia bacterium]|nr:GHMP kinase [Kiritimatiellia bacterium]
MLITQTPLRISFSGGGTDLSAYYRKRSGAVVSTAIDKFIYVILNQRFDDMIYLSYSKKEIVSNVDEIQHELIREAMRMTGVEKGIELAIMADIPSEGSGLGSSSSLTVGLLNALYTYRGILVTAEQLAHEACRIEIDICGKPIGKQDQYIAAYGGLRYFEFRPDDSVLVDDLPVGKLRPELSNRLMLFFTNTTRKSQNILKEQTERTGEKMNYLDDIRALADRTRQSLERGELDDIGAILKQNWDLKRELASGITNPEIELMVELAMSAGAGGCKICGAGGGGFLLVYAPHDKTEHIRKNLKNYREMPFFMERAGSRVIFNVEGYEWK